MDWIKKEVTVVEKIFENTQAIANTMHTALNTAFSYNDEHPFGQDILVAQGLLRQELELVPNLKPGDIDVLIVPFDEKPLLNKIIAVELKVVRPTVEKPSKNATSMGVSQVKGLLRDGFPYVGLVHVVLPEPSPKELLWDVPMVSNQLDKNGNLQYTGQTVSLDPFPVLGAFRQGGKQNDSICCELLNRIDFLIKNEPDFFQLIEWYKKS